MVVRRIKCVVALGVAPCGEAHRQISAVCIRHGVACRHRVGHRARRIFYKIIGVHRYRRGIVNRGNIDDKTLCGAGVHTPIGGATVIRKANGDRGGAVGIGRWGVA